MGFIFRNQKVIFFLQTSIKMIRNVKWKKLTLNSSISNRKEFEDFIVESILNRGQVRL